MTSYIHLPTLKIRNCIDLGGTWLVNIEYHGETTEILSDKDFKEEWEKFNPLKNYKKL